MRSRLGFARAGAVIGASAATLALTAAPASAEQVEGSLTGDDVLGYKVNLQGGSHYTALMELAVTTGKTLRVYCVEIDEAADPGATMVEHDWDAYPNSKSPFTKDKNRQKINWVLHHSYPAVATDELEDAVGGDIGLNKREAITATQAAIWLYSDGKKIDTRNPVASGGANDTAHDSDVRTLYNYLTGAANTGIAKQPTPALDIKADETKGQPGELIGPLRIVTNGEVTKLDADVPAGTGVTDAQGKDLGHADVRNGAEFYIQIPEGAEPGEATMTVAASSEVDTGRLFIAKDYGQDPAQSLIVASSDKVQLTDTITLSWGPEAGTEESGSQTPPATTTTAPASNETPTPSSSTSQQAGPAPTTTDTNVSKADTENLAYTGASVVAPALIGLVLIGAGALTLILVRRRKKV